MSEWNLSVRLTGQGSDLVSTLRDSAKEARTLTRRIKAARRAIRDLQETAATPIDIHLTVDGDHLRSDVQAAVTAAGDDHGIAIRLGVDGDHLRSEIQTAITAAGDDHKVAVRLDVDDAHLSGEVQTAVAAAGQGHGIAVQLGVDGDHLRDEVQAAVTAAGTGHSITVPLDVDADHLRDEVAAAITAATAGQSIDLSVDITGTTTAIAALERLREQAQLTSHNLNSLQRYAREAGNELSELGVKARFAASGIRSLNTATLRSHGRLEGLSERSRTLRTDLDDLNGSTRRLGGSLGGLRGSLGTAGRSGQDAGKKFEFSKKELILLAQALAPVAAAAVPVAQAMAAAGVGTAAFGIAIAGQISKLTEAAEAEKKYKDAVDEHGKTSQEAIKAQVAYHKVMAKMPPATRETAAAFSSLKDEYKSWSDSLASDTMPVATKGLQVMSMLLPKLTPMVKGAATEFDRLVTFAGGAIDTPGFDRLMEKLSGASTEALHHIVNGIVDLVQAAEGFSGNQDMAEFLDYCRKNGPLVAETLKNLAQAAVHLMAATADSGVSILTLVNALAKLVNAVPTGAISTFLQLYAALRLVKMGAAAVAAVTGSQAATGLAAFVRSARFGGVGPAIVGVTQRMSTMSKVAGALGILGAVAVGIDALADHARGAPPDVDKLTTSLKNLGTAGKFTGELQSTFGDMDGFIGKLKLLDAEKANLAKYKDSAWSGFIPAFDKVAPKLDDLVNGHKSMGALSDDFKSMDQSMAQLVSNGHADVAAAQFKKFEAAMRASGMSTSEIKKIFPDYTGAVADLKAEQDIAAQGMGAFGREAINTKTKLDAQKQSADGLRMSIQALNDVNRAASGAMNAFEQAIDDTSKAAKEHRNQLSMNHGELDLNTQGARDAESALRDLAGKTDEATAAAREQGKSWEDVNGIYKRGRSAFIENARAMGLTKAEAGQLADQMLRIPKKTSTKFDMQTEDAVTGLNSVISAIKKTPDAKSVTVKALTEDAVALLQSLGFKVEQMPNGSFKVTAQTGSALDNIGGVQRARDALTGKSINVGANTGGFWGAVRGLAGKVLGTSYINVAYRKVDSSASPKFKADGGVMSAYANGGFHSPRVRTFAQGGENHVAQIARAGDWRVWAEDETGGESYIPLSRTKRPRSRKIAEETVRRLGGNPDMIQWNAAGSVTDWRYDPSSGSLYSASDAGSAGHKTRKVKVKGKTKEVDYFDIGAVEKKLKSAAKATQSWNKDLEKVADRAGGDVAEALASMGKDGMALAKKMANGSTKYINDMAKALRDLQKTAKASLSDYTRQLGTANKLNKTFSDNLATLAAQGFGDLAKQLAAQNDEAAQQLAAAAVKDKGKASSANAAAKTANNALTGDQVEQLVAIIAAIKTSKTGIHDVAATTGLGEDEIVATATKATSQIKSALGGRSARFLTDLGKANKGLAYANGGIRSGIYATKGGAVTFAEPSTGGEAFIPLGAGKRRSALPVLNDVAGRFGLGMRDASEGRVVIIREQGPLVGAQHWHIADSPRTRDLVRQIDDQNGYQLRRLSRGGVAAR
ncbi:hypothetical protein [Streptomyces sp. NPDC058297]|uniref:hypothetical protein n=1 Tax=Streptomyces sp. NPDC058297 TaxID=3346433 RepID=UPI0036E0ACF1